VGHAGGAEGEIAALCVRAWACIPGRGEAGDTQGARTDTNIQNKLLLSSNTPYPHRSIIAGPLLFGARH